MLPLVSQLRAVCVSASTASNTAAASDALALANDMAARPQDYAVPDWVQSLGRLLAFLRSRNRAALAFKRKAAGAAVIIGLALWAYRRWAADQRRKAKSRAMALEAQEAAVRGQRYLSPSPSPPSESRREDLSLGDRFMESHPPQNEGALIPVESSFDKKKAASGSGAGASGPEDKAQKHRVAVDALFFSRLRKILAIAVPSVWSTEFRYLTILTGLLFARTAFSIWIAELLGMNAQSMVSRKWGRLWKGLKFFALITIPASAVNSGLKYYQEMTSLRFRKRLSEHVHEQYLDGTNFYKACNLGGDERIDNADQRVTADIKDFSDEIAALYSSMLKPLLDVVLFTWKLGTLLGWQGPLAMHSYFVLSGYIKKAVMPNLGKLVARESELEGFYRTAHNRLITNSEEIAFYDGSAKEKKIINNALQLICAHISYARYVKALIGIFDGLLVKYYASIAGYVVLLSPFILNLNTNSSTADLTRDYIRNSQYLGQLSTAVGQLVMVGNKLNSIAGYTSRVSELLEQVAHLNAVGNEPFEIKPEVPHIAEAVQAGSEYTTFVQSWKQRCDEQHQLRLEIRAASAHYEQPAQSALNNNAVAPADPHSSDVRHIVGGGTIQLGESIEFQHVDIVSPEGKLLVHDLNFAVTPGVNVMVTGPNGVGKSSLFRIIGELWPLHSGVLIKPSKEEILFVPQKPYLVLGTLRDQIIYPHEYEDMKRLGVTDAHLAQLLAIVDPARNITTEWGWDTVKDWFHAFSGGQKQRVAMARLFYHRPKFAILDECTSAVSDEVESTIYSTCRLLGITIFTVSHRPQLARFHDRVLRFEGQTRWSVTEIDSKAEMEKADKEKQILAAAAAASVALTSAMSSTALNKMQNSGSTRNFANAASVSSSSASSSFAAAPAPTAATPATIEDSSDGDRDATGDADPAATPAPAATASSSAISNNNNSATPQQPQHAAGQQQQGGGGGGGGKKKRGGRH